MGIGFEKREERNRLIQIREPHQFLIPSGYCMKFKRKAWERLGGLNEQFINGGEDQDIGLRALDAGMSVGYIDNPMVHRHSQSAGRFDNTDSNVRLLKELWPNDKILRLLTKLRKVKIKDIPVLFTTFNRLEYTKKSLKSLLKSNCGQIYIIDNASTDGTRKYLKRLKSKRLNIIFNKENLGVRGAMQHFFDLTKDYTWVAKVDNDTLVPKDWLSKLQNCALANNLDIVQAKHGITKETAEKGWKGMMSVCTKIANGVYQSNCVGGSGVIIRRAAITELPESDWVLGGWTHWQKRNRQVKKGFCEKVKITLFDTDEKGADYSKYPDYYKFTKRLK